MDALFFLWELLTRPVSALLVEQAIIWWIPLVAAAAAAVLGSIGERKKEKRQRDLANALKQYQSTKAAEGRSAIEEFTKKLTPEAQTEERSTIENALRAEYAGAAERAKGYEPIEDYAGRKGPRYIETREAGRERTRERVERAINQLAVIGAPAQRDLARSIRFGTAATEVDATNLASNRLAQLYSEIINQQQAPAWARIGSQVLGGVAGGLWGGGGTGGTTTPKPKPSTMSVTSGGSYGLA